MTTNNRNIPIKNLGLLYVNGLQITVASNTTLGMATGQARDSSNTIDMPLTSAVVINGAVNGANGLDTGTLAASTKYAVYLIGSSTNKEPVAGIISTTTTGPVLPFDYDSWRLIGWAFTDGSIHFLKVNIYGNGNVRKYYWDATVTALNAQGHASTYAAVDLSASVPVTSNLAILNWKFVPATAGNTALLRPTGSSSTTNILLTGSVASQPNAGVFTMNCNASQSIDYITSNNSDALSLFVAGFEDFI